MQAMLLAAGFGTRLRPYTHLRPKPLFPVLNRPLLFILLDQLNQAGCSRVVVNGHHLSAQVEKAIGGRKGVTYQHEPAILGTGGSLRKALPQFADEPVLVMNGDIFQGIDLDALYAHHLQSGSRITMAMHDYRRFNTVRVAEDAVRSFGSPPVHDSREMLAFTGIHVVDPSIIEMIPSPGFFHIIDLYEDLVRQGERIACFRVDGSVWRDIGTVGDYLELHGDLLAGKIDPPPPVTVPPGQWLVGSGVRVDGSAQLSGWGCIGEADIGHGVRLHNCVVWDGAVIPDGTILSDAVIAPGLSAETVVE